MRSHFQSKSQVSKQAYLLVKSPMYDGIHKTMRFLIPERGQDHRFKQGVTEKDPTSKAGWGAVRKTCWGCRLPVMIRKRRTGCQGSRSP